MRQLRVLVFLLLSTEITKNLTLSSYCSLPIGPDVNIDIRSWKALAYHWEALQMSLSGRSNPQPLLRTIGDFGINIGKLGFRPAAYLILDEVIQIGKGLERPIVIY